MSDLRTLVKNTSWLSGSVPISVGLGIAETALLARMLGPEGMGLLAVFGATNAIAIGLLRSNSGETALVFAARALAAGNRRDAARVIRFCYAADLCSSAGAVAIVASLGLAFPWLLRLPKEDGSLQALYALVLLIKAPYATSDALLRLLDRYSWVFFANLGRSTLELALIALAYFASAGLPAVVGALLISELVDATLVALMAHRASRHHGLELLRRPPAPAGRMPGEIWRFQALGYGRSLTKTLQGYGDTMLLQYLADERSVGLFRAARQISELAGLPAQAAVTAVMPQYSQLWFAGERGRLRRLLAQLSALLLGGGGLILVFFLGFGDRVIDLVFGSEFIPMRDALNVLLLCNLVAFAMTPLNVLLVATGRATPATIAGVATVAAQTGLFLLLAPPLGLVGAALARLGALLVSAAVTGPAALSQLRRGRPAAT